MLTYLLTYLRTYFLLTYLTQVEWFGQRLVSDDESLRKCGLLALDALDGVRCQSPNPYPLF